MLIISKTPYVQPNLFHPWINLYSLSQMKSLIRKLLSLITKIRIRGLDAFKVLSAKPGVPKAAPHRRWVYTTISFGPSDCPENMAGAGVLPLVTAPVISNVRLYHMLIDGGAGLNIISYAAFK